MNSFTNPSAQPNESTDALFAHPALRFLGGIDTEAPDVARRRISLVFFAVIGVVLSSLVVLISLFSVRDGSALQLYMVIAADLCFVCTVVLGWRGHTDLGGLIAGFGITVVSLIPAYVSGDIDTGAIYILVGVLVGGLSLRPAYIWGIVAFNTVGLIILHFVGSLGPLSTIPQFLLDLGVLNVGLGFVGWLNALATERMFQRVYEAAERLALKKREEREAQLARELAEQASESKSVFLATVSHELRTPLNAIIGYSELIEEDLHDLSLDDSTMLRDITRIHGAGEHLLALISDVLDLSKIEAGHMELDITEVRVDEFIHELRATAEPLLQSNDNDFEVRAETAPDVIQIDRVKLRQFLFNLLSNAAKFTHEGRVTLTVTQADEEVLFEVEDTGIGMTEAEQQKVFDDFVQADASTTRRYGGTGLGLSLSLRLAHLLGGELAVSSTKNVGSCFVLRVPQETQPQS